MFTGSHYEKRTFHLRKEDDFAALEKILKEYHGRILMCRIGRRNAVDIASYERKGVDRDLAALSITEFGCDSSPGVSNIDFSLYARLPRNLPILRWSTSVADLFELRFRDYQMIHGSLASQDYLRSFLRDIANSDCSKFHIQQLQEMSRFLKERESESESAVLSSELIEPLNNM
ncbi:hypothetical protein AB6A40_010405 [Gnathostoma spinigerum]|uniref:Uncharacterized protein n=1 Tax=Gnathostoma spinigerum TaxID=75299 RepID=A0ABD6F131_9BILA